MTGASGGNQRRPVVTYVDPPWAFDPEGEVDPSWAVREREILGGVIELRLGPAVGRRYVQEGEGFLGAVSGADALVVHRCFVTPELLDAVGDNLKVVGRLGVGFDNLNPELLKTRGIIGFNIPDYCIDEVVTHALALLLALERGIIPQHETLAGGRFDIYAGGMPRRLREPAARGPCPSVRHWPGGGSISMREGCRGGCASARRVSSASVGLAAWWPPDCVCSTTVWWRTTRTCRQI